MWESIAKKDELEIVFEVDIKQVNRNLENSDKKIEISAEISGNPQQVIIPIRLELT